ncbi:hypothetical protein R5R35_001484 [Gryllus longicercus]|uniref:Thaumatin-like protein n=1 Tax=Gryllus longicercus TaxID=2509291 RepID=A0AAN9VRF7_9ORTH|nr:Thaumatin-like protein 2 [Gryllus bimaculatus]
MAFWKLLVATVALVAVAEARLFELHNRLPYTIWVGTQGNSGMPAPMGGGFELRAGQKVDIHTDEKWGGRFWARTGCRFDRNGQGLCETGDCGRKLKCGGNGGAPPATLAEFTLTGWGGQDFYDVSNVDGFNLPTTIETINKKGGGDKYFCTTAACRADINGQCPGELRQVVNGRTVGCKSACLQFNTDQYCCRGAHNRPETCRSSDWPKNYPAFFKKMCPDAYSYAYDDHKSTFKCVGTGYRVIFG